ncbi:MAG: tyrosine-type recombinase/integrase [Chloroflexi bacterium]|nr:tyrosine-type recombinase/integrase [Chloroflexota bacterium]
MSDLRQLPLFPHAPDSPADLNRHTHLGDTIGLFQGALLKEGKSAHTVAAFTADLQLLAEFCGADRSLGNFTTTQLNEFMHWLEYGRGVPCSRKSYARRVTTLKVFFKWLHQIGAIPDDPARPLLQRSGPAPLAEILTPDDELSALAFARGLRRGKKPDARPEVVFRLILNTGIKKSEAMRLLPADIDRTEPDQPLLIVRHKIKNVYKERRIDLDPTLLPVLDEYLGQYAQPRAKKGGLIFSCTARNLEYILADISEGADLPVRIAFEMLRWTSAVRDYQAGVEPDVIRDKLGLSEVSWVETFSKIKRLASDQASAEV